MDETPLTGRAIARSAYAPATGLFAVPICRGGTIVGDRVVPLSPERSADPRVGAGVAA